MLANPDTYICAGCHHVFLFGDRDRAESEAMRTCARVAPEDCSIVCDACFREIWTDVFGTEPPGPVLH